MGDNIRLIRIGGKFGVRVNRDNKVVIYFSVKNYLNYLWRRVVSN